MGITVKNNKPMIKVLSDKIVMPPEPYKRPTDWLPIPQFDSENKDEIYILNGVGLNCLNQIYFKLTVSDVTNATIDWGDGQTTIITSTSQTTYNHKYNYEDLPDSSYTEHNQTKQALIHITTNRGKITYFSTAGIQYKYTNADGKTINYNENISTDIYEINADVQESKVYCSGTYYQTRQLPKKLEIFDWKGAITNTSMQYMFYSCDTLQSIPQLDTSNVTDMQYMFAGCNSLRLIPQLDTSKVTSMINMFGNCYSLLTIPQLDTSKVTSMGYMFYFCNSLQSIPQLDTSSVTNMNNMFDTCIVLKSISQLDTRNVTSMNGMFKSCNTLCLVPQLNTSKVINIAGIFNYCYNLSFIPELDVTSANRLDINTYDYSLVNFKLFNAGAVNQQSMSINLTDSTMMTKQQLVDLFNSVCPNTVSGNTRTIQIGTTLQGYLADCYVKDSGSVYTAILPTSDTTVDTSKTYYTYNEVTGEYIQFTGTTFEQDVFYYELKTATWNRYDICESTDEGAMLTLDFMRNIKNWTVS